MRTILFSLALISSPVLAQVGFYKMAEPHGVSRTWAEMCIEKSTNESLNVRFFGGYCPTVGNDCGNGRFDDMSFEAKPEKGVLLYKADSCTLRVVLRKNGATVVQHGHCSNYDLFAGKYVKHATEVWEDDCGPTGGPDTHHE